MQSKAHGLRFAQQTWAELPVNEPFIPSLPFATCIIEDADKSELEYFLLAGYELTEESRPVVGDCDPVQCAEGFPVYTGPPRTTGLSALMPVCGVGSL